MNPFTRGRGGPPPPLGRPGMGKLASTAAPPIPEAAPPEAAPPEAAPPVAGPGGGEVPREPIAPEALCFREAYKVCSNCKHRQGGQCTWMQMPVADGDGCNAFEPGESSAAEGEEEETEEYGEESAGVSEEAPVVVAEEEEEPVYA